MSLQLGPVLRGIRGHRAAAALVVVQLGIGLALTVLAILIGDYFMHRNDVPLGVPADDLYFVEVQRREPADESALLGVGVLVDHLPLHALERPPDDLGPIEAIELDASPGIVATTGLRLLAGRDFVDTDRAAAIISRSVATALSLDIGGRFVSRAHGETVVVGIVDDVPGYLFGQTGATVIYAKQRTRSAYTLMIVRGRIPTPPGEHVSVVAAMDHVRRNVGSVGSVLGVLGTLVASIVIVIFIGSMGLTYFLVAQRTREIGLRRAMGATRRDVVVHFVVENILLTIAGAALGIAILLLTLPALFEQEGFAVRWWLITVSVIAIVVLNVIATLVPASKAAAVAPLVASRST